MKRDMEVIKQVLEVVEKSESTWITLEQASEELPDVDVRALRYHVDKCVDAGLLRLAFPSEGLSKVILTWQGHDYLDCMSGVDREEVKEKLRAYIAGDPPQQK